MLVEIMKWIFLNEIFDLSHSLPVLFKLELRIAILPIATVKDGNLI